MGLAVGAHQAGPVHPQHHMEVLQGHVVDQHVIAPLQKRGVHGKHRDHALAGKSRCHGDPMSLSNGHIKKAIRKFLGEGTQSRAIRHGGGNGANPAVLGGAIHQGLTEY